MKILDKMAMLAAVLLVASCAQRDITVTTNVRGDGSCVRTVTFKGDSSILVGAVCSDEKGALLSLNDWEKSWSIDNGMSLHPYPMSSAQYDSLAQELASGGYNKSPSDTVLLSAVRRFGSVESMAALQPLQIDGVQLEARGSFDKKFRWFYTYYTFNETYGALKNKYPLPMEDYVKPEVASYWFTGSPNLMQGYTPLESKDKLDAMQTDVERWLSACWMALCCDVVASHYLKITDAPVNKDSFVHNRNALLKYSLQKGLEVTNNSLSFIDEYYSCNAFTKSLKDDSLFQDELDNRCQFLFDVAALDARYNLIMPGTVIDAGNGAVVDGVVEYHLTGSRLIPHSYTISATSRQLNAWAVVVTVLLLLAAGWVIIRKRR